MLHELEHPCPPTIISKGSLNVCFWHKADISIAYHAATRLREDPQMGVHRIVRWSLIIAMLFAVFAAVAQTNSPTPGANGGGKFHAACGQDVRRFCVGMQPGGGRLVQCLSSHTTELSPACGNTIAALQARRGTSNPSAENPATQPTPPVTVGNSPAKIGSILRASCGPDVQRLCAGARREGEVLKCLDSRRMELSKTCSLYFQGLGARPIARENTPNKKRPSKPPTTPIPVQENAPDEKPLSLPPATIPAQENAPNKKPTSRPPTTPIPD